MTKAVLRLIAVSLIATGTISVAADPAAAEVSGVAPSNATVYAGESAQSRVTVKSDDTSCLSLATSSAHISASVSPACGSGKWTATLVVSASEGAPPGNYSVRVVDSADGEPDGRTFTLRVKPTPTTSTTAAPTTTAPPSTTSPPTTSSPTTTSPPATTSPSPSTTDSPPSTSSPSTTGSGSSPGSTSGPSTTSGSTNGGSTAEGSTTSGGGSASEGGSTSGGGAFAAGPTPTSPPRVLGRLITRAPRTLTQSRLPFGITLGVPAPPAQPAPEPPPEPTPAPAIPVVAFASVESMVDAGIPDAGVFLPLRSGAFKWCFPLVKSCGDSSTGLVLVPANKSSVAWQVDEGAVPLPEPLDVTSPKPLQLAGSPPADLASQRLALPILDVAAAGDGRRVLVQSLGSDGLMAAPPEDLAPGPVAAPVPEGPSTLPPAPAEPPVVPAGGIFGRPTLARSSQFSENAPALVVLPAPSGNVVHGLRPDPSWEAGVEILPFFTRNSVPYLVRGADGTPGLFLARPIGFRSSDMKVEAGAGGGGSGGLADAAPPVLAMLAAAVVVELGIFAAQMRRRRYRLANGSARQSRFTRRGFSPSRR